MRAASPRFRRWAQAFPLTRPVARRRARALFDMCAGFVHAQVLAACLELGLFDLLAEAPRTETELAERLGLPPAGLAALLQAAEGLRLVRRANGRVMLGALGGATVGNPAIAAMVAHHGMLYQDLADPLAVLRGQGGTRLSAYWPYAGAAEPGALTGEAVSPYTALMAASQPMVADEVLAAYSVARHESLLDVGGGDGTFLAHVHAAAPRLRLTLLDLPGVASRARLRFERDGIRAAVVAGSFAGGDLPGGADLITLVRVLHDHDDAVVESLLAAVRRALPPGGTVLIAEPLAGTPGAASVGAYFAIYLRAMGSGRPRTAADYRAMLGRAGFARVAEHATRMPLVTRVITGRV